MLTDNLNSIEKDSLLTTLGNIIRSIKNLETQMVLNKKQISSEPEWVAPTYTNSWVNFGSSYENGKYGKDQRNFVILKGLVKSGTINTSMFTLPAGFRPLAKRVFPVASNSTIGVVEVRTDGTVVPTIGNNTYVSLEGISFYAEA